MQAILPTYGPTSYGNQAMAEGLSLAMKVVANYGLSPLGITICAPPASGALRKKNSHEVAVDDSDSDLTRGIQGRPYQVLLRSTIW